MQTEVHARLLPSSIVVPAFAATLFISAGLMFLVEPMVAKMVLPRLGGSPAVWSTCLVFFQATLLLGYGYAHALTRMLPRSTQIQVHAAVLLLAALALPLDLGAGAPPPGDSPSLWLLIRLVLVAGPPVFAISATAPLLQSWFAWLDHKAAGDPYFLYTGSNLGSLLALLAYPLLLEPALPLDRQAWLWSCGFGALALGIALCAGAAVCGERHGIEVLPRDALAPGRLRERLTWIALAFVPSSLLLGVTTHITLDIAAVPLLWVVPLMLYLLTFILAFARRPPLRQATIAWVISRSLIALALFWTPGGELMMPVWLMLTLNLGCLFAVGMGCHGELARQRPPTARLTEFYFFLSAGGVLGGVFNALVAPLIFSGLWEYPLVLLAACLIKPATPEDARRGLTWDILLPLALLCEVLLARSVLTAGSEGGHIPLLIATFGYFVPGVALLHFATRRWRFALGVAACLLATVATGQGNTIATARSFFGVYRVSIEGDTHESFLKLMDGTTLHGVRSLVPGEERLPMAYYSHDGPFGRFFAALAPESVRHVAVIGLGSGGLACYARPSQDWTFFEIDPLVERIARDPRYFQFLANCGNQPRVVLGDARLSIAGSPDGTYDVLILDAFSSDSIPMHLLTREALAMYLRKLAPGGHLLFHISSRSLDLIPVVRALAADAGVPVRMLLDRPPPGTPVLRRCQALVVALAGRGGDLSGLDPADGWTELPPAGARPPWTDQRSDILGAIRFGF
ncbi:MAG: spermidine synthase [Beijerinckiaceae bacterium]